jgi:hypothetical protein
MSTFKYSNPESSFTVYMVIMSYTLLISAVYLLTNNTWKGNESLRKQDKSGTQVIIVLHQKEEYGTGGFMWDN